MKKERKWWIDLIPFVLGAMTIALSFAQTTRDVVIAAVPTDPTSLTGWNLYRAIGAPTNAMIKLNASPIALDAGYRDSQPLVGGTYTYWAAFIAAPCTPATPITSICGQGQLTSPVTVSIPRGPTSTGTVTVIIP